MQYAQGPDASIVPVYKGTKLFLDRTAQQDTDPNSNNKRLN